MSGVCLVCRSDGWPLERHRLELLSSGLDRPARSWVWLCGTCVGRWVAGEPLAQIPPASTAPALEPGGVTTEVRRPNGPRRPGRDIRVRRTVADETGAVSDGLATAALGGWRAISPREREVAALVARGCTNAEIARELVLEVGTVANHVANILRKLELRSRVELAVWAVRSGLPGVPGRDAPDGPVGELDGRVASPDGLTA